MLSNSEKMVVISSTTKEWPQNQIDEKNLMASTSKLMEKPGHQEQPQPQQPLKCPRCDSSNTKFCYYNNYSLSQPRHFCKACKRYWTRGGTLRNVPVGGGCRKNKRVKRPASSIDGSSSIPSANSNPSTQSQIDISSTSNHINPLFYGLSTNPSDLNLQISRFNSRVSSVDTISGYDLQPQLSTLGLRFSSGILSTDAADCNYLNGFNTNKQIQEVVTPNILLSSHPTFGSSSSTTTTSPTMASLLATSLHQQKLMNSGIKSTQLPNYFNNLASIEDLQMTANGDARMGMKDVKAEEGQNKMDWNVSRQNQMEQIGLCDPTLSWNATSIGAWLDPANIGSSVTSLI